MQLAVVPMGPFFHSQVPAACSSVAVQFAGKVWLNHAWRHILIAFVTTSMSGVVKGLLNRGWACCYYPDLISWFDIIQILRISWDTTKLGACISAIFFHDVVWWHLWCYYLLMIVLRGDAIMVPQHVLFICGLTNVPWVRLQSCCSLCSVYSANHVLLLQGIRMYACSASWAHVAVHVWFVPDVHCWPVWILIAQGAIGFVSALLWQGKFGLFYITATRTWGCLS